MPPTDFTRERQIGRQRSAGANRGVGPFTIWLIVALRAVFLCELLVFVQKRDWANLFFYGAIFVGSLVVPLLGRFDPEYYRLDIFATFIFAMGPLFTSFGVWPEPEDIPTLLFGQDKPLHIAGGACLAIFAAITLRMRVTSASVFYLLIVVFTLALGAAWEIFEWLASIVPPPFNLKSSGLDDSMLDLIADTVGALIASAVLKARGYHERWM